MRRVLMIQGAIWHHEGNRGDAIISNVLQGHFLGSARGDPWQYFLRSIDSCAESGNGTVKVQRGAISADYVP
jgi:hypothetical protein